jgi:probable transcriptional regulator
MNPCIDGFASLPDENTPCFSVPGVRAKKFFHPTLDIPNSRFYIVIMAADKTVNSKSKGQLTREHILEVAAQVFAQRGYSETRLDDIIQATGLTKGALYFHFRSKSDLAYAVIEDHKRHWLEQGIQEIAQHDNPLEQLEALSNLLITLVSQGKTDWNIVRLADQVRSKEPPEDLISPLQSWVDVVADIIERGKAQQIFHTELSSQDAAAILVGSFDGLKTSNDALAQGDTEKFRRQAHALNTMLIEGLQRR